MTTTKTKVAGGLAAGGGALSLTSFLIGFSLAGGGQHDRPRDETLGTATAVAACLGVMDPSKTSADNAIALVRCVLITKPQAMREIDAGSTST